MAWISIAETEAGFSCADGDTILRAALRAGVGLPYKCNSGACGECRFALLDGQLAEDRRRYQGLSDRDIERGRRLACQARPQTDCTIAVQPDPSAIPSILPVAARCDITAESDFGSDLIRIRVSAPASCLPGQYALLRRAGEIIDKPLGIMTGPETPQVWDFLLAPGLDAAAAVFVDGPYGTAFYRPGSRHEICVADQRGLAQASAIVRAALADPRCESVNVLVASGSLSGRDQQVLFGSDPRLTTTVLPLPPEGGEAQRVRQVAGALQASLQSRDEELRGTATLHLFGSAPMVAGCRRLLHQEPQVRPENIYFDAYYEEDAAT